MHPWSSYLANECSPGCIWLELLTSCAVLTMLGVILANIFGVTRDAFELGSERTSMHKLAINTMDKITPMIGSANPIPPDNQFFPDTIEQPSAATSPANELRFVSSVNHFGATDLSTLPDLTYYRYRIALVAGAEGNQIVFQQYDESDVTYAGPPLGERVLAFSKDEARVESLAFGVYGTDPLDVHVGLTVGTTIRGATGQRRDVNYTLHRRRRFGHRHLGCQQGEPNLCCRGHPTRHRRLGRNTAPLPRRRRARRGRRRLGYPEQESLHRCDHRP